MTEGSCHFCTRPGPRRGGTEDGLDGDLFVCGSCWKLLKRPETALPLLRGDASIGLRGVVPGAVAQPMVDSFMRAMEELTRRASRS